MGWLCANFSKFTTQLWPLVIVKISFLLNISSVMEITLHVSLVLCGILTKLCLLPRFIFGLYTLKRNGYFQGRRICQNCFAPFEKGSTLKEELLTMASTHKGGNMFFVRFFFFFFFFFPFQGNTFQKVSEVQESKQEFAYSAPLTKDGRKSSPAVTKHFSCLTQLNRKFSLLIHVSSIVGIFIFIGIDMYKQRKVHAMFSKKDFAIVSNMRFISRTNFMLS